MARNWGECKECKWWQIEAEATITDQTVGHCIEQSMQKYEIKIAGNGGCNMFTHGEPARLAVPSD